MKQQYLTTDSSVKYISQQTDDKQLKTLFNTKKTFRYRFRMFVKKLKGQCIKY